MLYLRNIIYIKFFEYIRYILKGWQGMDIDEELNNMLDALIDEIKTIIENKAMQSGYGSLEPLLKNVFEMMERKLYLTDKWFLDMPRWLGECVITIQETDVHNRICRINLYVAERYHGGWGKKKI